MEEIQRDPGRAAARACGAMRRWTRAVDVTDDTSTPIVSRSIVQSRARRRRAPRTRALRLSLSSSAKNPRAAMGKGAPWWGRTCDLCGTCFRRHPDRIGMYRHRGHGGYVTQHDLFPRILQSNPIVSPKIRVPPLVGYYTLLLAHKDQSQICPDQNGGNS